MHTLLDIILHLDTHLNEWANALGPTGYVGLLFLIVFCETGLVVTPFLPGDSLLFTAGALSASDNSAVHPATLVIALIAAAVLGDAANYWIGRKVGPKVFTSESSRWLNKKHLMRTHSFYEKHGGKTIILARFIPFIRTFAPFVAGIGEMSYPRFLSFNVVGGAAWVSAFVLAGHRFANLPVVKQRFHLVILAIIVISLVPVAIEYLRARREK